ncbi:folylpolyglutamate synthase, mitochondrial [Drosophila obscura]|uniref:folylpolyglutamate synthase, mitochondrial n=1 Tax=Drosophila obscura TaxID=7282 RepID=UPI001BB198B7|nr:folylpolyglutamate synthase, mitochondrial [Drosophila obscura]
MLSMIMSGARRPGLTVWKGTTRTGSNKFFKKGLKPNEEPEPESLKKQKHTENTHYPSSGVKKTAATAPSFSDQRAKWTKYSAEMQLKAKLAAQGVVKPANPNPPVVVGQNKKPTDGQSNWQQSMPSKGNAVGDAGLGSSAEEQRKSWMNRMHGSQKNQAQLLKDLSAKQQAGRDLQMKKKQEINKMESEFKAVGPNQSAAVAEAEELDEKSPERLAYLEAVRQLNIYQAFEPVTGRMRSKVSKFQVDPVIEHTLALLSKVGVSKEQLESIPVIQVAGSKGKGTTCVIVHNILMAHGIKTGLLCAPHLFYSRERIRINGEPLTEVQFTELTGKFYPKLAEMDPTPAHSQILTAMACLAFREANVDVAIVEVGLGGASDCTNVTLHAKTIGISTLGWEQGSNLSESMRDIAWAKGEIMKPSATIFTNVSQPECREVLAQKAKQMGAKLHSVPTFNALTEGNPSHKRFLTKANQSVKLNASLGTQLAYDYLRRHKPEFAVGLEPKTTQLTEAAMRGLETFESVGHFDIIKHDMYNVYLDSADSIESMMVCREWFYTLTRAHRATKILLYNKTSDFNAKDLLTILRFNVNFDEAFFVPCPNFFEGEILPEEEWRGMEELQRAKRNARTWRGLCEETGKKDSSHITVSVNAFFDQVQSKYGQQQYGMKREVDVLVTGSRPLVAATITLLNKMRGLH